MLLRLAYLGMTNVFALLRLLPMSNGDKDAEILALRHQLSVLQRQLGPDRVRFAPGDRALLAALLHRLPREVLKRLHVMVRPAGAGIDVVLSGVRMPRMNSIMERWVQTCRHELSDRTLIWNQSHLLHALREFELFCNEHRPHQGIANARPPATARATGGS